MGTSFYPQSGVMRRAQTNAVPAERTPRPWAGLPEAVGVTAVDPPRAGESNALGTLPLYAYATAELGVRQRVLDAGCGDGRGAEWLTRHYSEVVAIDENDAVVESARKNAPGARVHRGDVCTTRDIGAIDGAVCIDLLAYVAAPEELLAAIRALVDRDARLFVAEPRAHIAQCPAPPLRRAFSQRSLTTLLTMSGFDPTRWIEGPTGFVACVATASSDNSAEWLGRGYGQLAAQALDDALACFERAEGSARAAVQLEAALGEAECFLSQRKRGAATDAFLRARELCPSDARPIAGLARVALGRGEIDQALELANVAYRIDPTDVAAACAYAMVGDKAHRGEAKERWVRAANLAPESFDIALRVAHAAVAEQDYAVALWAVARVRSYGRDHGLPMHVAIATALLGTGRTTEALAEARLAQSLAPEDASVRALLSALR